MKDPTRVEFTVHALEQIARRGLSELQAADVVLGQHRQRRRNPGSADWIVRGRGIYAAYNWPDGDDETTAYVVSVWPG